MDIQDLESSPFHQGEQDIQTRVGVREKAEMLARRVVRGYMPDEHREFFKQQSIVFVGTVDPEGQPWASILVGKQGFISSSDEQLLEIKTNPIFSDPLSENIKHNHFIGLLGLEFSTRRRNRMNGKVVLNNDHGFSVKVDQSFGNCPKYIQARKGSFTYDMDNLGSIKKILQSENLLFSMQKIINKTDTFFIASSSNSHLDASDQESASVGVDISHRGGKPGFVQIKNNTLLFPDYAGNNHFNTLGNIKENPACGLLFIDFDTGDTLQLIGEATIIWDENEIPFSAKAERMISFQLKKGVYTKKAVPMKWDFEGYSRFLES